MERTIKIAKDVDSVVCSEQAVSFAEQLGFEGTALWEIAIAVSELVTNVVKFAGRGQLAMRKLQGPKHGLEIVVEDEGPGIEDIQAAMLDGYSEGRVLSEEVLPSERRGLGAGLGAVQRLMSSVEIENKDGGGSRVTVQKWLPLPGRGRG